MSSYGDEQFLVDPTTSAGSSGVFNKYVRPCTAECVGTAFFVFIGTMAVQLGDFSGIAVAHGLTIAILVAGLGPISGGHFNPAVSVGATLGKGLELVLLPCYVASQLLGGILGAALCRGVLSATYVDIDGGGHALGNGVDVWEGLLCEVILTSLLVLVVLTTAVDTDGKNVIHPLAIGFTVAADIFAGVKTTGASMNPARSFGPAVVISGVSGAKSLWTNHWIYWAGPVLGALLAGLMYRLIFAKPQNRIILKEE